VNCCYITARGIFNAQLQFYGVVLPVYQAFAIGGYYIKGNP
jgi:hypothetical protein